MDEEECKQALLSRIKEDPKALVRDFVHAQAYIRLSPADRSAMLGEIVFLSVVYSCPEDQERLVGAILDWVSPEMEEEIAGDLRERIQRWELEDLV